MITLKIDDQTYARWRAQASSLGLSVEDWLMTRTGEREQRDEVPACDDKASHHRQFRTRLEAIAKRHQPPEFPVDVSREGIYD